MMEPIKLNDLLQLSDEQIKKTKLRFMIKSDRVSFNPLLDVDDMKKQEELNYLHLVHNAEKKIYFKEEDIAIGFIPVPGRKDYWLMTGIVQIVKNNGLGKPATAKYLTQKYNFRIVVEYHVSSQTHVLKAEKLINNLDVIELWNPEKGINDKTFPGFKRVCISYKDLKKKMDISDEWVTALKSRKGVYLITDRNNGKQYVGSAYGKDGIFGRWKTYIESGYSKRKTENGDYPNIEFKKLVKENGRGYIEKYFQFSILETITEDEPDEYIIARESWWKDALLSREYGYNAN